ncbi:MAG: hypothetical protein AAF715_15330 [Myxococcota bacterium]
MSQEPHDAPEVEQRLEAATADEAAPPPMPLEDFAFISAGLSDGLPADELFARRGRDPRDWRKAEAYWLTALVDDLDPSSSSEAPSSAPSSTAPPSGVSSAPLPGTLSVRLGTLQARARRDWTRTVVPLEEDFEAWTGFFRHYAEQSNPVAWLGERGLVPDDLLRLQQTWAGRLLADESLRQKQAELMSRPPAESVLVTLGPLVFVEPTETDLDGTGVLPALGLGDDVAPALPFVAAGRSPAGVRPSPDLVAALPAPPRDADDPDATGWLNPALVPGLVVPFFEPTAPEVAPPAPEEGLRAAASSSPASRSAASRSPVLQSPELNVPTPASAAEAHPPAEALAAAFSSASAAPSPTADATVVGGVPTLPEEVLPFRPSSVPHASAGPPSGSPSPPELPPARGPAASAPDETVVGGVPTLPEDVLPFSSSPRRIEAEPTPRPEPTLIPGGLTLRQFAALTVDVQRAPHQVNAVLDAFGIDRASYLAHHSALVRWIHHHPAVKTHFDAARADHQRRRETQLRRGTEQ